VRIAPYATKAATKQTATLPHPWQAEERSLPGPVLMSASIKSTPTALAATRQGDEDAKKDRVVTILKENKIDPYPLTTTTKERREAWMETAKKFKMLT